VEPEIFGKGPESADRIETVFDYPDSPNTNVISLEPGGWRMRTTGTPKGKPTKEFSDRHYRPIACAKAGMFPL